MPRTAQIAARGFGHRWRGWRETFGGVSRRVFEGLGAALVLASFLTLLALLTYNPADASLDTAVDVAPSNYLGRDGAIFADVLFQSVGLAAYLVPVVLLGWAFNLLLQRPIRHLPRRLLMVLLTLFLGAAACSILHPVLGMPAGAGGTVGWLLLDAASRTELVSFELPLAMIAAALVGLLLLTIVGLSPSDWRVLGNGAGRRATSLARASGHGTAIAAAFGQRLAHDWWQARQGRPSAVPAGSSAAGRGGAGITPLSDRREPHIGSTGESPAPPAQQRPAAPVDAAAETPANRLVRLVMPRSRPTPPGKRSDDELQTKFDLTPHDQPLLPELSLLTKAPATRTETIDEEALSKNARMLEAVLDDYGVRGQIVQVRPGPVVTLYELEPAPGIKASRVIGLADDIARSMSAISVRVAVVPGRTVIGIELPNRKAETVYLRELLDSPAYEKSTGRLALALGKDIGGEPVIADLARMPHLLIAGTTGSGKSVGINTMILSILYRMTPETCKFIMVDPKMLELSVYDGIPHLLSPVVTDPKKAVMALKWTVREMESRYQKMSKLGVRNIEGFNNRLREATARGESLVRKVQIGFDPETGQPIFEEQPFDTNELPLIIVIVDEMADLMLVAGKDIEASVQRLAQMARAAGIHIIMATQRPSVDVITGTIKANFPTRISFQVTSKIDSRTILGEGGAEQLLGRGDMLYMAGGGRVTRVHAPFVSDEEVERVVSFLKMRGQPDYIDEITEDDGGAIDPFASDDEGGSGDALYDQAVALVCRERKASTSFVQRHLQIGYNRAARLIERMELEAVVSTANHVGKREVLARKIE
ncbi:MAG TPA: DNA translocase FtsK 4TM domain-containing protein [Stellaceae bacterium]|jgi:S-DNA-T family DNA segregation ATPase FtsK/SpoIIIE|nr:DNA translocase FtsK 4TM domain-containing protein [Stellaceae bacterium]